MRKILIVVDMQNDFIDGSLGTKEAISIVPNVINKIKKYKNNNDLILFTKDTHYDDYLETQEGRNLPIKHCIKNTKGWELQEEIKIFADNIYEKNTFGSRDLAELLTNKFNNENIQIELIGLCTDICVISNAMLIKSFMPETKILVDALCCAGVSTQSHKDAINSMKMCQIEIINEEM
ncbi:cysteine hydrolase family protein [Clostridium sp. M14]|uniref:cysteine hydrolase family protein n=1 Tax=Clostridium sp. M14 TaxID=2716311 RepID=UPI0013EE7734|nr:isochorismatase family cysteine hydrolase [Clostridium sp. M14]MBZ9693267.1 cysteine hydrolase [Clostridium sp. M14]